MSFLLLLCFSLVLVCCVCGGFNWPNKTTRLNYCEVNNYKFKGRLVMEETSSLGV